MRQIITFLFLVMINISHAQNDCQQVSLSGAKQLALNIINKGKDSQQAHIQASYQKTDEFGNVILYEIVTESTTVLLSGSKVCMPVLGEYSSSNNSLIENYDNLPCNLRSFLDGYISQIEMCFRGDTVQYCHQGHGTVAMPISIGAAQRHLL